jgi:CMP-N,N'-diacetyllegionaminic acid synthase
MNIRTSSICALIPARKGSNRLKQKNISIIAGKPLLQWTIESALKTKLTNIFLTTDYVPHELGFKMPDGVQWVSRPKEYCTNEATAQMYIKHFFDTYPQYEVIVLLQPTCPLRTSKDIDNALDLFLNTKQSSEVRKGIKTLISAYKIPHKQKLYRTNYTKKVVSVYGPELLSDEGQELYHRNSAIYIFTRTYFERFNSIFASNGTLIYEMPMMRSIDIDTHLDFIYAERMLKYKSGGMDDELDFDLAIDNNVDDNNR